MGSTNTHTAKVRCVAEYLRDTRGLTKEIALR